MKSSYVINYVFEMFPLFRNYDIYCHIVMFILKFSWTQIRDTDSYSNTDPTKHKYEFVSRICVQENFHSCSFINCTGRFLFFILFFAKDFRLKSTKVPCFYIVKAKSRRDNYDNSLLINYLSKYIDFEDY